MGILTLLFVVLPLVDLWLLLIIGDVLGFWPTVGLTIGVALLGGYLGKREGLKVLSQWQRALGELRMPEDGLVSAALVLVGAVLLVTPGVLTDVLGLLCLFPPTRRLLAKGVSAYVARRLARAAERGTVTVRVVGVDAGPVGFGGSVRVRDAQREVHDTEGILLLEDRTTGRAPESAPK